MFYLGVVQKVNRFAENNELYKSDETDGQKCTQDKSWQKAWSKDTDQQPEDPLLNSLQAAFQNEGRKAMAIHFLYYQLTVLVPLLSFFIFQHIENNTFTSTPCIALVAAVVLIKIGKSLLRVCSEGRLRRIGQGMYDLLSRAVLEKTFKVSLLSNHNVVGSELVKIMQVDMEKIINFPEVRASLLANIYATTFNLILIALLFGLAGLIGIVVMVATISLRVCFRRTIETYEEDLAGETGKRVRETVDILNIIKFIKVTALELPYFHRLVGLREDELEVLHSKNKFEIIPLFTVTIALRLVVLVVCLLLIASNSQIDAAIMFTLNLILISTNFYSLMTGLSYLKEIKISLKNIDAFLSTDEMDNTHITRHLAPTAEPIIIQRGNFYWQLKNEDKAEAGETVTPARVWLRGLQLRVKRGEFVSVIGRFGSGKSSLLQALLGEMRDGGGSRISLSGRVAYAAQKPWIVNDTVRGNILFGAPFDPARYAAAVHFSALKADLEILSDGDQTLIGERGCTLSGGQKARVALARALYADADVILLDDILSAVDAHVGAFLFFETFGKHCRGKTIVMVTHALHYVQHTDRILIMDNCNVIANGTYQQLKMHPALRQIQVAEKKERRNEVTTLKLDSLNKSANEDVVQVIQQDKALEHFFQRSGGLSFKILSIFLLSLALVSNVAINLWMNVWANSSDYSESKYPLIYVLLMLLTSFTIMLLFYYILHSPILSNVFKDMARGTLFAPLAYFETTPTARIVQRMSRDLHRLDKVVLMEFFSFATSMVLVFAFAFTNICAYIKSSLLALFLLFLAVLAVALYYYRKYFLACKAYRHLEEELKVPLNTFYGEAVHGQATIRAYGKVGEKERQFSVKRLQLANTKKVVGGIDSLISFILSFSSTIYLLLLLLSYFLTSSFTVYHVFILANVVCLEELLQRANKFVIQFLDKLKCLTKCEQLAELTPEEGYKQMISEWDEETVYEKVALTRSLSPFTRGEIEFKEVSVSYRPELGDVLRGVSFKVKAGEKVGVVGRTGSGKSTLFLALLRIVSPRAGVVLVDGVDCSLVGLTSLRASVNFILQQHFLFGGSVRENADPSGVHSDEEIAHVLGLCGLWEGLQRREGLETAVTEGGENLSAGERQLLNIARALLSRRRVVLVDEATASIDSQSDAAIQRVLRTHFAESTVLTIAHRLDSVAHCDRILGLEAGEVKEFDTPANLLKRKDSLYQQLCEQTMGKN